VAVLLRLAEHVRHLALHRVEPLIESRDRRLGRGRLRRDASGIGRSATRKHLTLHLVDLPFEALDPLLGSWRLALGSSGGRKQCNHRRSGDQVKITD
jgi:hypothetical protein